MLCRINGIVSCNIIWNVIVFSFNLFYDNINLNLELVYKKIVYRSFYLIVF
jgi:hypothetical protein